MGGASAMCHGEVCSLVPGIIVVSETSCCTKCVQLVPHSSHSSTLFVYANSVSALLLLGVAINMYGSRSEKVFYQINLIFHRFTKVFTEINHTFYADWQNFLPLKDFHHTVTLFTSLEQMFKNHTFSANIV